MESPPAAETSAVAMLDSGEVPLCVDLDGTLVKTNTLVEIILALARSHPLSLLLVPFWLLRGQAYLWERLVAKTRIAVGQLPYRDEVLKLIRQARNVNRPVFLVTGAHETLALQIAQHLDCFSAVYATKSERHFVGQEKADLLVNLFGEQGFDYIGDSSDDDAVWTRARRRMRIGPLGSSDRNTKSEDTLVEVPTTSVFRELLKAVRPHQWSKNLLVLVPLVLAHRFELQTIATAAVTILAFSLAASSCYFLNDLIDLEADRSHLTKRKRPLAAGTVPLHIAMVGTVILGMSGLAAALLVSWKTATVITLYMLLTSAYSMGLKSRVVVDVVMLAVLYALRLVAGAVATEIRLSPWTLAFSIFIFLSLALMKRFAELRNLRDRALTEAQGRGYLVEDLPQISALGSASGLVAVLVVALYINGSDVQSLYRRPELLWLICPLLIAWICRLWILTHRGQLTEDPVLFALHDRWSWGVGVLVALVFLLAI